MNIIVAHETVRIYFSVIVALDLDYCVIELILAATEVCNFAECLQRVVRFNVHCHCVLATSN